MTVIEESSEDDEWKVVGEDGATSYATADDDFEGQEFSDDASTGLGSAAIAADTSSIFGNVSNVGLTALTDKEKEEIAEKAEEERLKQMKKEDQEFQRKHPKIYTNKRWGRDNDMRQIIRDLADYGEKMVQPDRSRDYEEEFEETESEGNLEIDSQESNEDLQQLKKEMIANKEKKSKKIIIKPQKTTTKIDKLLKVDRNLLYEDGED